MLDVLHYLFEEDVDFVSSEHIESRNNVRNIVYKSVYNMTYKYGTRKESPDFTDASGMDVNVMGAAQTNEVKPYMPPTNFNPDADNPFQGILREAPLG